jgi:uncharacterized protein (TIRG00374 family)
MFLYILFWGSILTFIFVLGSFLILAFKFGKTTDWEYIFKLNYLYLFFALLLLFLYHTFDVLRLRTIAKGFKVDYPFLYGYRMSFIMTFAATVTPAHIGGELSIFYLLGRLGVKRTRIFGTVLFKTLSGLSFFIIALPILVFYALSNPFILKKILILFLIFLVFSVISIPFIKWFRQAEEKKTRKLKKTLKLYCLALMYFWRHKKRELILASLYSILLYVTFLSFAPLLLFSLHIKANLVDIYMLELPLVFAIFSSPSPGGSGVGELGGVTIFEHLLPASLLGLFVILWRLFSQYLSALIGGILLSQMLYEDISRKKSS